VVEGEHGPALYALYGERWYVGVGMCLREMSH